MSLLGIFIILCNLYYGIFPCVYIVTSVLIKNVGFLKAETAGLHSLVVSTVIDI